MVADGAPEDRAMLDELPQTTMRVSEGLIGFMSDGLPRTTRRLYEYEGDSE